MSMLARFRKIGGFSQLLLLLETTEGERQRQLMRMVASEDPGWAYMVRGKLLTVDRILNWPIDVLLEISPLISDSVATVIWIQIQPYQQDKWLKCISPNRLRAIKELAGAKEWTSGEKNAAAIKLIQTVRQLIQEDKIPLQSVDPSLVLDKKLVS